MLDIIRARATPFRQMMMPFQRSPAMRDDDADYLFAIMFCFRQALSADKVITQAAGKGGGKGRATRRYQDNADVDSPRPAQQSGKGGARL